MWRAPRAANRALDQEDPLRPRQSPADPGETAANRSVFDEVSAGHRCGPANWLAGLPPRGDGAREHPADAARLERLSMLQQQLEQQDGWRVEERVSSSSSRSWDCRPTAWWRASGGWRRRTLPRQALVSEPESCCCSTSRPTTSTWDAIPVARGSFSSRGFPARSLFVTPIARSFRTWRPAWRPDVDRGQLTSWPGSYTTRIPKRRRRRSKPRSATGPPRQETGAGRIWLRQGLKARRTRNEGRV